MVLVTPPHLRYKLDVSLTSVVYSTAYLLTHTYLCARDLICTLSQANRTLDLEQKQGLVILA